MSAVLYEIPERGKQIREVEQLVLNALNIVNEMNLNKLKARLHRLFMYI